jgi:hypothetical protein
MERPDLATLACVNPECRLCRQAGHGNLVIRKVYGRDGIRLLRCRTCCEEFSERRWSALFNRSWKLISSLGGEAGGVRQRRVTSMPLAVPWPPGGQPCQSPP